MTNVNSSNTAIAIKGRGVEKPSDLAGRKVGSAAGSAARDMFASVAKANGLDPARIETRTVSGSLRESLLVRGEVDAIVSSIISGVLTLQSLGVERQNLVVMPYSDYGVPLYGNAIVTRAQFAAENPETVRAFVRACNAAMKAAIADPKRTVASLHDRDALIDLEIERQRLLLMFERMVLNDEVRAQGLGSVVPERMRQTIAANYAAYALQGEMQPSGVYTDDFLPPPADRIPPPIGS